MNAITGVLSIVKAKPERISEFITKLDNETRNLLDLINNVLDISGMEYGILKLVETQFSFRTMLNNVLSDTARYSEAKNQTIIKKVDDSLPDILIGDEKYLSQLIGCLLSNAVKYSPENGEINIAVKLVNDDNEHSIIQVEVADNGVGIHKKQHEAIFNIFEQVEGGNNRKFGGIGIGLALSRRIIKLMGGTIWVESEPGKGSTFYFTCKLRKAL